MREIPSELFTLQVRVALVVVACVGLLQIYKWLSRRHLGPGYGMLWIVVFLGLMIIALFPVTVFWAAGVTGAREPEGGLRLAAFIFVFVMLLYMSVKISQLERRIEELVQALALREARGEGSSSSRRERAGLPVDGPLPTGGETS